MGEEKQKKKKDRKRKRRVKVNFVFCTMYLPDLQTSVQTCWFRNRRQHSVRLILNDEFQEQEFSWTTANRGRTVANKLRRAWLVFLQSSISFSVFKCTLQFLKFISRFEISFKFLITLQETKSNRISFCNVKCCTYEVLGLDQPITSFLQSFNTSQGGKDSVRQGRYCIGRELSVKNETIK